MTITDIIALTSAIVSSVGVSFTAQSIRVSQRESKKARDVQTALHIFEVFRQSWISTWRKVFEAIEEAQAKAAAQSQTTFDLSPEQREQFFDMLNWMDGIGRLIDRNGITDAKLVFGTFEYQIRKMIEVSHPIINRGIKVNNEDYWRGLCAFARLYEINLRQPRSVPVLHDGELTPMKINTVNEIISPEAKSPDVVAVPNTVMKKPPLENEVLVIRQEP